MSNQVYLVFWRSFYPPKEFPDVLGIFSSQKEAEDRVKHFQDKEWNVDETYDTFRWIKDREDWILQFASLIQPNMWGIYGHMSIVAFNLGEYRSMKGEVISHQEN